MYRIVFPSQAQTKFASFSLRHHEAAALSQEAETQSPKAAAAIVSEALSAANLRPSGYEPFNVSEQLAWPLLFQIAVGKFENATRAMQFEEILSFACSYFILPFK